MCADVKPSLSLLNQLMGLRLEEEGPPGDYRCVQGGGGGEPKPLLPALSLLSQLTGSCMRMPAAGASAEGGRKGGAAMGHRRGEGSDRGGEENQKTPRGCLGLRCQSRGGGENQLVFARSLRLRCPSRSPSPDFGQSLSSVTAIRLFPLPPSCPPPFLAPAALSEWIAELARVRVAHPMTFTPPGGDAIVAQQAIQVRDETRRGMAG